MTGAPRVLVCDDEPQILRALTVVLSEAGFEILPAATASEALDHAALHPTHAAIIDLMLPDGDGIELCQQLRGWSDMPILVLSAVDEEQEKVRALTTGADDYVTKPFSARELVARLEAVLRRASPDPAESRVAVGELEIDFGAHTVRDSRGEIHLTEIEYELLRLLAQNRGKLMTHRALLTQVWGSAYEADIPTLRFHVANLRKKIDPSGRRERYIRTEIGVGYRFVT
jgi:two-component system KDP operon response regulator KdpE